MINTLKVVHLGCASGISNETAIKYQKSSEESLRELQQLDESEVPLIPRINTDNCHSGVHAIIPSYTSLDQSPDIWYRILEKSTHFSTIHDATTYWAFYQT